MDILTQILAVFEAIGVWISEQMPTFMSLFYTAGESGAAGSLTFLGVLAVAGLGISVVFLLIGIIQRFVHFRG